MHFFYLKSFCICIYEKMFGFHCLKCIVLFILHVRKRKGTSFIKGQLIMLSRCLKGALVWNQKKLTTNQFSTKLHELPEAKRMTHHFIDTSTSQRTLVMVFFHQIILKPKFHFPNICLISNMTAEDRYYLGKTSRITNEKQNWSKWMVE